MGESEYGEKADMRLLFGDGSIGDLTVAIIVLLRTTRGNEEIKLLDVDSEKLPSILLVRRQTIDHEGVDVRGRTKHIIQASIVVSQVYCV